MPSNGLNVGTDFSFGLYDANTGQTLKMGDIQSIKETGKKHDLFSRVYNDVPKYIYVNDGYEGSFTIVRTRSELEDLQILLSNNFNNGVPIRTGYINKIVTNGDGSVSKYQYQGVCFFLTDIGDTSREKTITQTLVWMAGDKQRLA